MKLIKTTVKGPLVRMLYADAPTKDEATEWLEMVVKADGDDNRRLGVIQAAALQRVRALIGEENRRFESLADRIP